MSKKTKEKKLNTEELDALRAENLDLKNKVADIENSWKRALADYQNLQKRISEERLSVISYANQSIILRMLLVLDSLELLQKHSSDEGLVLIIREFSGILKEEGLEEIETTNKEFDLTTMEAIELVGGKEKKVIETVQKGYKLKNKIVRPAKVKVGKGGK